MRQMMTYWIPAAFCAFLSLLALIGSISTDAKWWQPAFYAFLPMCFFFVGASMSQIHREVGELRKRLGQLEQK